MGTNNIYHLERIDGATPLPLVLVYHGPDLGVAIAIYFHESVYLPTWMVDFYGLKSQEKSIPNTLKYGGFYLD